jgi:hypothetical protein
MFSGLLLGYAYRAYISTAEGGGTGIHLLGKHLLNGSCLRHQTPDLDALDQVPALLPISILQRLARLHDMIPGAFGRTGEDLPIGKVQEPPERF